MPSSNTASISQTFGSTPSPHASSLCSYRQFSLIASSTGRLCVHIPDFAVELGCPTRGWRVVLTWRKQGEDVNKRSLVLQNLDNNLLSIVQVDTSVLIPSQYPHQLFSYFVVLLGFLDPSFKSLFPALLDYLVQLP